jgi:hypothetical protein
VTTQTSRIPDVTDVNDILNRGWLPAGPLVSAVARSGERSNLSDSQSRQLLRARTRGYISIWLADEICCSVLRLHPVTVFGQNWVDALAAHDRLRKVNSK